MREYLHALSPKQWLGYGLVFLAGAMFYVVFEHVDSGLIKALGLVVGSVIIDIAVDMVLLKVEKARGDVD